jgi:CheY-like chemotaxis protein
VYGLLNPKFSKFSKFSREEPLLSKSSQNVLLVSSDPTARAHLESALFKLGVHLDVADDGLFALTVLERQPADVVISGSQLGDMSGQDLYEIIREDTSLINTSFVLLSGNNAQLLGRGHDIQIPENIGIDDTVSFVQGLLKKRIRATLDAEKLEQTQGKMQPLGRNTLESVRASKFGGTLEHFSLFDLLMLLTQTQKSGQLFLKINDIAALVLVDRGDVILAEYGNYIGENLFGFGSFLRKHLFLSILRRGNASRTGSSPQHQYPRRSVVAQYCHCPRPTQIHRDGRSRSIAFLSGDRCGYITLERVWV